jgi:hypothetical protein
MLRQSVLAIVYELYSSDSLETLMLCADVAASAQDLSAIIEAEGEAASKAAAAAAVAVAAESGRKGKGNSGMCTQVCVHGRGMRTQVCILRYVYSGMYTQVCVRGRGMRLLHTRHMLYYLCTQTDRHGASVLLLAALSWL